MLDPWMPTCELLCPSARTSLIVFITVRGTSILFRRQSQLYFVRYVRVEGFEVR